MALRKTEHHTSANDLEQLAPFSEARQGKKNVKNENNEEKQKDKGEEEVLRCVKSTALSPCSEHSHPGELDARVIMWHISCLATIRGDPGQHMWQHCPCLLHSQHGELDALVDPVGQQPSEEIRRQPGDRAHLRRSVLSSLSFFKHAC